MQPLSRRSLCGQQAEWGRHLQVSGARPLACPFLGTSDTPSQPTQPVTPSCSCSDGRVAPSCLTCVGHCSNGGSCTMNSKMMPECQ